MRGLTDQEIAILGIVEEGALDDPEQTISQLSLPRRLLEMGLLVRDAAGNPKLTRDGRNALFRSRCADALRRAEKNTALNAHVGVELWLRNSRFLALPLTDLTDLTALPEVTKRGKEWLASLDHDALADHPPGLKKRMLLPKLTRWLGRK